MVCDNDMENEGIITYYGIERVCGIINVQHRRQLRFLLNLIVIDLSPHS
jgi:hypothetical protein